MVCVQDERDRRITELEKEVTDLRTMVKALLVECERLRTENEDLQARLGQNSSNSNKPPSSDSPADREGRHGKPPSGRKRGGQPGHKGSQRQLLTPTKPPVDCFPASCRRCEKALRRKPDPAPRRHQVVELPKIVPEVSEWRLHRVRCECGEVTCGTLPAGVPTGMCGPGLMALIALLTGDYNMSRRRAVGLLSDVLGIEISLGALSDVEGKVSDALAAPANEIREHVADAPIKHSDATGWRQGGQPRTLWTIATTFATAFFITKDGSRPGLRGLFAKIKGILVSDRGRQFTFWAMHMRQICWAHLIRKFAGFAERDGPGGLVGESLLFCSQMILHYWHQVCDRTMSRRKFQRLMEPMRGLVERHLERAVALQVRGVSGSCADILEHRKALWTFVDIPGVEPTNNHGERELRAFVLWRKRSFGSQSDRGCVFAARIMSISHTLRKQKRHVLSFLTEACQAALSGNRPPSIAIPTP
jgi:transposase